MDQTVQRPQGRRRPERPWFDLEGAADYIGLNEWSFRKLVQEGKVKSTRTSEGERAPLRFHQDWLDNYLADRATGGEQ